MFQQNYRVDVCRRLVYMQQNIINDKLIVQDMTQVLLFKYDSLSTKWSLNAVTLDNKMCEPAKNKSRNIKIYIQVS